MKQHDEAENSVKMEKSTSTLPPRSDVHKKKKKKTKLKIKYPIIRLLALLFVLLPVAILSFKFNSDSDQLEPSFAKKSSNFESIIYEKKIDEEAPSANHINQEEAITITDETKVEEQDAKQDDTEQEPEPVKIEEAPSKEEKVKEVAENNTATTNEETKQPETKTEKPKDQYEIKYHTVKANETLYRISMKYYNSRSGEELIRRWNNLNGDAVIEGQVLRIPIKK